MLELLERRPRPISQLRNLNQQPYPSPDLATWVANFANGGAGTAEYKTGGIFGIPFYRMTWTTASTEIGRGVERVVPAGAIVPGGTYTVGGWARVGRTNSIYITALSTGSNGAGITQDYGAITNIPSNTWSYFSKTFVAPANATGVGIRIYSNNSSGGTAWAVGDTLDVTGLTLTEGPPVPYFDGNFSAAYWEGTPGNSRSVTPALMGIYPVSRLFEMGNLRYSSGGTGGSNVMLDDGPYAMSKAYTMYGAHVAGTTSARAQFLANTTSVLAVGRNSAGSGWFILTQAPNGSAQAPAVSRATGANVICGVREQLSLLIHSFVGNQITGPIAISGWGSAESADRINISSDIRYTELWSGVHVADIRFARMAQIRTLYGIAA